MKAHSAHASAKRDYVIVFGAAVRPNGRPSAALRRRIESAAVWAQAHPNSIVIPTGATRAHGPPEAKVVKAALMDRGVSGRRIIMELKGRDTLESVRYCHALMKLRGDCGRVVCCTSRYHQPRCALLLRMLGYEVILPRMRTTRGRLSLLGLARLFARELLALPYDAALLLARAKA